MYRPLPPQLTIKNSKIEGLGLFATENIKKNSYNGVTHIRDEQFDNKYIRTPLGGFYNHSNDPNVMRMVSDILPKLKFGDLVDESHQKELNCLLLLSFKIKIKKIQQETLNGIMFWLIMIKLLTHGVCLVARLQSIQVY